MRLHRWMPALALLGLAIAPAGARAAERTENFDKDPGWESVNSRTTHFDLKTVTQDFGYSPSTSHAGGKPGEIGGTINPAGETAYYGWPLPRTLSFNDPIHVSGKLNIPTGKSHFLLGFFNDKTLNEWRTPNTLVLRINNRGDGFQCHVEYCTSQWRAEAGVVGDIERGKRIVARTLPNNKVFEWSLDYDPTGAEGSGMATLTLDGEKFTCSILKEHRPDGATFTHFGLLPVLKTWDQAGEAWFDDLTINGRRFDFATDPQWDALNNRRTYQSGETRPRFDFGWSPTNHVNGKTNGEMGGLVYRGDCRYPERMASYGDRIETLTLDKPVRASGKIKVLRGVTDSSASIGFYNSVHSMKSSPSQECGVPMDSLGINIEGPSSEGFFFYPFYRTHGDNFQVHHRDTGGEAPRIHPDGKLHDWAMEYDPAGAGGNGRITVTLDGKSCHLDLGPGHKGIAASFDRFGICTPWVDGNSVTVYFDDLTYTSAQ